MMKIEELNVKERMQYCPGCVLPDTPIHTNPDVKNISHLNVGDRVLGDDGEYHKITEVMNHRYVGKMYKITVKNFGSCDLTHEHPVLIVKRESRHHHNRVFPFDWVEAENLKKGDYVVYPIPKTIKDIEQLPVKYDIKKKGKTRRLPTSFPVGSKLMRLFGYYLSEGHVHKREIIFTFNTKEKSLANDLKKIVLDIFGLSCSIKEKSKKHTVDVSINSSILSRLFLEWFGTGAQNKKIPHFVMLLPPEKQAELIKALWLGDGWLGKEKACYKTISSVLCHQLKLLLLRQGIVPILHSENAKGIHRRSYALHLVGSRDFNNLIRIVDPTKKAKQDSRRMSVLIKKDYVLLPIRKIETYEYDGQVYNLEVKDTHCYVSHNATLHNCGNYGLATALKGAIAELGLKPHETVIASGIGCSSKMPHYINTYGFEGIHGRPLPVASAIKLANTDLTVIAEGGDGDGYGIGVQHFVHIMRRNYNLTYIVHNNQIYGLTTGQASPTSLLGMKSKTTPWGVIETPFNPIAYAILGGATYVARGFAGEPAHLKELFKGAIRHKGFAFVDVFQPCVTFNKLNTYQWFQERVYKLEDTKHKTQDREAAMEKALEDMRSNYKKVPIGLFYKEDAPTYEDQLPQIKGKPLVKQDLKKIDLRKAYEELM